ncbi:MAG TPA: diguanylate cyclase [Ktedonobacteraceae bacterium]|nr:diguanylate cyclase [Ktedonobacteraceae bacterium]
MSTQQNDDAQPTWRATGLILLFYVLTLVVYALAIYLLQKSSNSLLQIGICAGGIALSGLVALRIIFVVRKTVVYARELHSLHIELHAKNHKLSEANTQLQALATTDPLTGLSNHRSLIAAIEQEMARAYRYRHKCTILFLDLDHFKAINDTYGHSIGDSILCDFAAQVNLNLRETDLQGRWGGEEFLVILPETGMEEACHISERVRSTIASHAFSMGGGMSLTCSIGIATFPDDASDRDGLVTCADQAMYAAKRLGRNQVRAASDPASLAFSINNHVHSSREEAALLGTVEALTALVEAHDEYTGQHTRRVAVLATHVALALGLDHTEARMIGLAGRLHDVGKVGISDSVLQKPEGLNDEEHASMLEHTIMGAEVVSQVPSLRALVPVIRAHHERWDGAGYPDGLAGEAIPLGARIVAVVDAYDAIITERHYQPAHDAAWAFNELRRCAGTQFDPHIVRALEEALTQNKNILSASNSMVA